MTAEQKVTRADNADHDVCGWSDGTLVRFEVRAGRLTNWIQGACKATAARRDLDATPQEWAQFAQRNAVLAASLTAAGSRARSGA